MLITWQLWLTVAQLFDQNQFPFVGFVLPKFSLRQTASIRGVPAPRDLFGLLRVENHALAEFFARDEWPLDEAQAHPGLTIVLNGQLPPDSVLRPILTARAFQLLVRAGYYSGS